MNLGIYIDTLSETKLLDGVSQCINNAIDNNLVKDASIFYDDIGFNPFNIKCGMFNSTDLWNFSGDLIATSLVTLHNAHNIVNNIDLFYYYGVEQNFAIIDFLYLIQKCNIKIICNTEDDAKEIYRISGITPIGIGNNFQNLLSIIKEYNNGRSENRQDVCRK
jgi:hypothetical protein